MFFFKLIQTFLFHPLDFLSKITPRRIWHFFQILGTEGTSVAFMRLNNHVSVFSLNKYSQKLNILKINEKLNKIGDYEPLTFKKEEIPQVSVIIPVYNQFNYTYNCLKSILLNSGSQISYEIIIADDCSDDITLQITEIIHNISIIRTGENLRFLRNCNNAAKHARGKYILLLNNDTQVQENWLFPLVELMQRDDSIGAVGSKMLLGNGMIFEAVSVIWNDGGAWNYGRNCNPCLPEFNYVKEVDYLSGASMMIKKTIWDELGGFDTRYAPAYYEDPDLCFSIRSHGYKVMYQPASVVVHFEGVSNGTNVSQGQKQYQVINQKKFYDKWKNILLNQQFPNGKNVFYARDRSRKKKTLLMIDHHIPHYDRDAGSKTVFHFLKLFSKLNFNIKFIGDDFVKYEPYAYTLEQMGIEVLYGKYYLNNWKQWIKDNGKYIDYVFLNRPHVSVKYIDIVKKYTKARIIYYGHDLHFLRESREYELTGKKYKLKSSRNYKKLEISIMKKADVVYYPSEIEVNVIKEIDSTVNCKSVPMNIFPVLDYTGFDYNKRNGLIFVGGFNHSPNIDAVLWFVNEIMPELRKNLFGVKLYVIGSNTIDKIKKLECDDVKILGYLEDSVLDEYYEKCRVSIVPLRYGAGVKGKLLEAMNKKVPVITTSIGAEGLPQVSECLITADEAHDFAGKLVNMYSNEHLLKELSENGYQYIQKHFTSESVIKIFKTDFDLV